MTRLASEALKRLRSYQGSLERALDDRTVRGPRAEHELAEVKAAIDRIEKDHFGRCERCAGAIGGQRLTASPTARLCAGCVAASAAGSAAGKP